MISSLQVTLPRPIVHLVSIFTNLALTGLDAIQATSNSTTACSTSPIHLEVSEVTRTGIVSHDKMGVFVTNEAVGGVAAGQASSHAFLAGVVVDKESRSAG